MNMTAAYLVQYNDRIGSARLVYGIQYTARKRTYIGLAMAPDFTLIMCTAESNSLVLAAKSSCYALTQGGLAHTRRAPQAE